MTYLPACPTYPKKPFAELENSLFENLKNMQINLKNYIYFSYCDSIEPNYTIPILDHNKAYSTSGFYPIGFQDVNISSDEGLYRIINYLIDQKTINQYQIIVVDVGIFWRYYKWIYNYEIRIPSSQSTSFILGFWHTYKELCMGIFKQSIRFLFGPVIGQLYENSTLLYKPKLGTLL